MSNVIDNCMDFVWNVPASVRGVRQYLVYTDLTLAGINAKRAAVVAQVAAGQPPTGYALAVCLPAACADDLSFPGQVYVFVVAEDVDGQYTLATDTAVADIGG